MRNPPIALVMMNDERVHVNSLNESQNMDVLRSWADVLSARATRGDAPSPELILGGETVKSVASAQRVGEELRRAGCRSLILCFNVWNFPYLVWPLLETFGRDAPLLSLSSNNGAYPGNVGLLATDGALRQVGLKTHRIIGDIGDGATTAAVADWMHAARAVTALRGEVYGLYGGHSMGMETGYFHLVPSVETFGSTLYQIDQLWVLERMKEVKSAEVQRGRDWFERLLGDRLLYDGDRLTPELLERQVRLYSAIQSLNAENGFGYCGIKGQRELSEYVCVPDVAEMLLNDPYDWNGPKESMVCATEADSLGAITMQTLKYISGGLPSLFMDVRLYHPEEDIWDLCNSGQHASWYATRTDDAARNLARVRFHPSLPLYFKAGGASVEFDAAPGELTFARFGLSRDRLYLVIVGGESVELRSELARAINAETNPTWPHVHARFRCAVSDFVEIFPANHIHATPGNRVQALKYFAELVGVEPLVLESRNGEGLAGGHPA